jgi:hypothetical protein
MTEFKSSRRKFLGVAGTSLASLAIASVSLNMPEASAFSKASAPQSPSMETWLLSTGQDDLNPELYTMALQQLRETRQ